MVDLYILCIQLIIMGAGLLSCYCIDLGSYEFVWFVLSCSVSKQEAYYFLLLAFTGSVVSYHAMYHTIASARN